MKFKLVIIEERGLVPTLYGLGLSYSLTSDMSLYPFELDDIVYEKLYDIATKLAHKGHGHNKFLESIQVWMVIDAPIYWWLEFDTYRIGITKQSESTMHTIGKRHLTNKDFEYPVDISYLNEINESIDAYNKGIMIIDELKAKLPAGFMQKREVCTNYKVLQEIIHQRESHKLLCWKSLCKEILRQVATPKFLKETTKK